jgi:hypothetical protein
MIKPHGVGCVTIRNHDIDGFLDLGDPLGLVVSMLTPPGVGEDGSPYPHDALTETESHPARDFWDARPPLHHICAFRYARPSSLWVVLRAVVLRALHRVPPCVTLPPYWSARAEQSHWAGDIESARACPQKAAFLAWEARESAHDDD